MANGSKVWYKNNKLHRDDMKDSTSALPAIICSDGHVEWWIDGIRIKKCENYQAII
jgi:hypothetical protein